MHVHIAAEKVKMLRLSHVSERDASPDIVFKSLACLNLSETFMGGCCKSLSVLECGLGKRVL